MNSLFLCLAILRGHPNTRAMLSRWLCCSFSYKCCPGEKSRLAIHSHKLHSNQVFIVAVGFQFAWVSDVGSKEPSSASVRKWYLHHDSTVPAPFGLHHHSGDCPVESGSTCSDHTCSCNCTDSSQRTFHSGCDVVYFWAFYHPPRVPSPESQFQISINLKKRSIWLLSGL